MTKSCSKCNETKYDGDFYVSKSSSDGLQSYCKSCKKELQKLPASRLSKLKYKLTELGKLSAKRYKEGSARKAATKRYLQGEAGKANAKMRREQEGVKEYHRLYQKQFEKTEKGMAIKNRYHASEKYAVVSQNNTNRRRAAANGENALTAAEWREIIESYSGLCVYCNKKCERPTQDHITPLAAGGTHTKENVVPACGSCNSSKNNNPLVFWMAKKSGYTTERLTHGY